MRIFRHLISCRPASHSTRTSFSTSAPRWPRTRLVSGRGRHQQQKIQGDIKQDAALNSPLEEKDSLSRELSEEQVQKQNPPPASFQDKLFRQKKRSAPAHLSPQSRSLFVPEVIRQGPDSDSALETGPASAEELRQLTVASRFFAQPPRFLYSAESLRHHAKNEHVPEILILGASNVGKSSFLNALVGKPDTARVSARPGRTTLMNAYGVGPPAKLAKGLIPMGEKMPLHSLVVVDTPGYGYKSQAQWGEAVTKYIGVRKSLRGAVLLISSEKKIAEQDRWLLRELALRNTRTSVVLTKADKGGPDWKEACGALARSLRAELRAAERSMGTKRWKEGSGWNPIIYITAAGMQKVPRLGNGGGIGGVRAAILEMAGFNLQGEEEAKMKDETIAYTGQVVSFDDIKWKG